MQESRKPFCICFEHSTLDTILFADTERSGVDLDSTQSPTCAAGTAHLPEPLSAPVLALLNLPTHLGSFRPLHLHLYVDVLVWGTPHALFKVLQLAPIAHAGSCFVCVLLLAT